MIAERDIKSHADEIAFGHQENCLEAETLLSEIVKANREPSYPETIYFQQRLGWDTAEVNRQRRRMSNVLRFKSIAGTAADREAALKEAATAAKVLESESPKLEQKINELTVKLSGLERDARLSARRVEDQSEAVLKLREHVPKTVADSVQVSRSQLDSTSRRQILDIGSRIHELECVLDRDRYPSDPRGQAAYMESVKRCRHHAVSVAVSNGYQKLAFSPEWPSIQRELETELAELQAKVEPLQSEYDRELAAIECGLDFYLDESRPA